jgi:hypothetical protein
MPSTIVHIPGVGDVEFPDSMSDADINAAAKRLYDEANTSRPAGGSLRTTAKSDSGLLETSAGLAASGSVLGAAVPLLARAAEEVATHPNMTKAAALAKNPAAILKGTPLAPLAKMVPGLNSASTVKQVYDVLTLKQSPVDAALDGLRNYAISRMPSAVQSGAGYLSRGLGLLSGPAVAGATTGAAVPLGFLGLLERDANRTPEIDPAANTPASGILRGFQTMAGQRKPR